jgi:hypothetical protein
MVTWGGDLYDIHTYHSGDPILISPDLFAEVSLPMFADPIVLGRVGGRGAELNLSRSFRWSLEKLGTDCGLKTLEQGGRIYRGKDAPYLVLEYNELFSVDFGHQIKAHVRYIRSQRPFLRRSWIENKEEFQNAIRISMAGHMVITAVALLSAPKPIVPQVENMPPRFAKLLVEPPKQILAAKPPPPPEPEPEAPPPPEPKPHKVVHPLSPKKVKQKNLAKRGPEKKPQAQAPQVNPAEKEAAQTAAVASLFNSLPGAAAPGSPPSNVKLSKTLPKNTGPGYRVSQVAGQVQNQADTVGVTDGAGKTLSASGGVAFAKTGGGKAGKRRVGGIVAEMPTFNGTPQGLTNEQVMKVVNAHLAEIQRCYERALFENSSLVGRIEYEWSISASGRVTSSSVKRSEVGNADFLNECVLKVFNAMHFPAAKNKLPTVASIGFPFGRH